MRRGRKTCNWAYRAVGAAWAIALLAPLVLAQPQHALLTVFDPSDARRPFRLGFRTDARPFSYKDSTGRPAGYSVALCEQVAAAAKRDLGLGDLQIEWVPLAANTRFQTLQEGQVDLICGAETETLARREQVSFSIPIFPGGIGVVVRADAPVRLREVLAGRSRIAQPIWRAAAVQALQARAFSIVEGTTSQRWLAERMTALQVMADTVSVSNHDAGIQAVLDRKTDAFFGERAILLNAARRHASGQQLIVIDRLFTYEPLALVVPRGNEAFRLLVDRALSRLYDSGAIVDLYARSFGEPDESTLTFFQWNTLK